METYPNQGYLDQIAVVLYQPQDVVNVAAIIRGMSNFGLRDLRLVEPAAFDPRRIEGIAHHTQDLIAATRHFLTLEAALADCGLVLGATGRQRTLERKVYSPRDAAPLLLESGSPSIKAAILFGTEQDGLPNEAINCCHGTIVIPTHRDNRSLNLAQAFIVLAYELWVTSTQQKAPPTPPPVLATGQETEAAFAALEQLLQTLYTSPTESRLQAALVRLRTLLLRAIPRKEEAQALTNLLRHTLRRLDPPEK